MDRASYQLCVELPQKSVEYLDWVIGEAQAQGGARLSKGAVVRALLNVTMRLDVDVAALANERQLEERIWATIERRAKRQLAKGS